MTDLITAEEAQKLLDGWVSQERCIPLVDAAPDLARSLIAAYAELAQVRADAKAAVALVVEKATNFDVIHAALHNAEALHREDGTLGDYARAVVAAIRALADVNTLDDPQVKIVHDEINKDGSIYYPPATCALVVRFYRALLKAGFVASRKKEKQG